MVIDMGYWTRVAKKIVILLISLLAIFLLFKFAIFYMPFLIGFIISLMIEPIIRFVVKKTKLARKTSAIIVLLLIFSILIGLIIGAVFTIITESSNLLQSLNIYIEKIYNQIQHYMEKINLSQIKIPEQVFGIINSATSKFLSTVTEYTTKFFTSLLQAITSIPIVSIYVIITILSTYFICADKLYILDQMEHHFPKTWVKRFAIHLRAITKSLGSYLKAELILIGISFAIVLIGLYIFRFLGFNIPYPLLAAIGIGFVDALPILRFWYGYDSMGYNFSIKRRFTFRNRINNSICHYSYCKTSN